MWLPYAMSFQFRISLARTPYHSAICPIVSPRFTRYSRLTLPCVERETPPFEREAIARARDPGLRDDLNRTCLWSESYAKGFFSITADSGMGMANRVPIDSRRSLRMLLTSLRMAAVRSYRRAISESVSPLFTVCVAQSFFFSGGTFA